MISLRKTILRDCGVLRGATVRPRSSAPHGAIDKAA
jgi:hypothetical protein